MNLIGKVVYIKSEDSIYNNEWGVIKHFDGDYYHVAIANGNGAWPIFSRDEFIVKRKLPKNMHNDLLRRVTNDNHSNL